MQIVALKRERGELLALQRAAEDLQGRLVAGTRIVVRSDTVYREIQAVPTADSAGTRRAMLSDSTPEGYKILIEGVAPPSGPLRLGYKLETPEFRPEVGWVELPGGQHAAVVSWAGQEYVLEQSFYQPPTPPAWSLAAVGRVDAGLRTLAGLELRRQLGRGWSASVSGTRGAGGGIGLEVRKTLWSK